MHFGIKFVYNQTLLHYPRCVVDMLKKKLYHAFRFIFFLNGKVTADFITFIIIVYAY